MYVHTHFLSVLTARRAPARALIPTHEGTRIHLAALGVSTITDANMPGARYPGSSN